MNINPEKALNYVIENAPKYAQAKANRRYLEEYRKTLKAKLFMQAPDGTVVDRESWAYAHEEYQTNLEGLKVAVEEEERLRWMLEAAMAKVEVWRTLEASNRQIIGKTT